MSLRIGKRSRQPHLDPIQISQLAAYCDLTGCTVEHCVHEAIESFIEVQVSVRTEAYIERLSKTKAAGSA